MANIHKALDMWAATMMESRGDAPWTNSNELYKTINVIQHGDAQWKMYHIQYCWSSLGSPKWLRMGYEPKVSPAGSW